MIFITESADLDEKVQGATESLKTIVPLKNLESQISLGAASFRNRAPLPKLSLDMINNPTSLPLISSKEKLPSNKQEGDSY